MNISLPSGISPSEAKLRSANCLRPYGDVKMNILRGSHTNPNQLEPRRCVTLRCEEGFVRRNQRRGSKFIVSIKGSFSPSFGSADYM